MKKRTLGAAASVLGSFLVLVSGSACQVTVGKDDATGGQSTTDSGGSDALGGSASTSGGRQDASTGGVAQGGSASAQGGSANTQGGSASTQGGSASAQGGSMPSGGSGSATGGSTGDPGTPYAEECGAPEPQENNDRDTAIALGPGATVCIDPNDNDWFYVDTPADGKAHILQLDFDQEPAAWTYIDIYAKTDGSRISSFHLDKGVKSNVFVTLGPGARTLFDFSAYNSSGAKTTVKAALTTENDGFEPNNERETAAAIKAGQKISAQMLVPYVAQQQSEPADWFKVELTAGDHVFHLTAVPQEIFLKIAISDSSRVNLGSAHPPNRGAIFDVPFTVPSDGTYFFAVENYSENPPVVTSGNKPHFLSESYTFQID